MKKTTKFGFCAPIFAHPGVLFFRTPGYRKLDWKTLKESAQKAEKLGYDSLFIADHLFLGHEGEIWESVSTMSALAALTKKIEIVPIHLCDSFRHPSVLAKTLATLSHISNGRVTLFYDYGWRKEEFDQYGLDFMTDEKRIEKMGEGLEVIKGLTTQDRFSFSGEYYSVSDAVCTPKPVKDIPIWLGEANQPKMVEQIVKYADVFNSTPCTLDAFEKKLETVKAECKKQGRDFEDLEISYETQVLIRETDEELKEAIRELKSLEKDNTSFDEDKLEEVKKENPGLSDGSLESLKKEFFIGTPEEVKEKVQAFKEKGVSHFMLWFMDYPDAKSMEIFANDVMPYVR
ncbi:hypothetical protein CL654_02875 [bacterium]|nr:hypothetical protein [bacterium]|tara:strand:- start:24947 stop:25981 length:1035 start_codon:yes stop_codon:yes gene_type:complete